MDPPVFSEVTEVKHFDSHELQGVTLTDLPPDVVPIKVVIDVESCNLTILPDGPSGSIKVSGEYDTANGQFEFIHDQSPEGQQFRIGYKSGSSFLFNIGNEDLDAILDRNHLTIHLPRDSALDLQVRHEKGDCDIDISEVPIYRMDLSSKMSQLTTRNRVKNPIVLQEFNLSHSMGETRVKNLQNYRFDRLNVDFSMGEFRLKSDDLFYRSALINMDVSFGGCLMNFPENVELVNQVDSDSGSLFISDNQSSEKNVQVTLEGTVKWGEASISQ